MSQKQLDDLFAASPAGAIPNGEANGTAIIASGTTFSAEMAELIEIFGWKGKTFDAAHGTLMNRISAFGVNAIVAEVYQTASWFDGKECIVLDYSKTSLVAEHIRDEIRRDQSGDVSRSGVLEQRQDDPFCAAVSKFMTPQSNLMVLAPIAPIGLTIFASCWPP